MSADQAPALHVLVVDPQAGHAARVRGMLVALGHRVRMAHDWRMAETLLTLQSFDVVVMAIETPGPRGAPASQALRGGAGRWAGLPLIGLGVGVHRRDAEAARAAGFDALLARPFPADALAAALEEALRHRAAPALLDDAVRAALRQAQGPAALLALDEGAVARAAHAMEPLMAGPAGRSEIRDAILAVAEAMEAVGATHVSGQARRMIEGGPAAMRGIHPLLQAIVASRFALRADRMNAAQADPIWAASDTPPGETP
ncbi:hypothetical protein [Roseomonas sp. CECT 9278]|uniref:hypothetical protein n=1 Tax=Roseomonas sp. CECT 9278 TaxID=2845823 RepID=UPI001E2F7065|nr:hypothetical protein [Roseomonas sp. CECT 9278]CAH0288365.1 hypothetical protein ROS9278_04154 [Roseomonas sp. CECT 9278]